MFDDNEHNGHCWYDTINFGIDTCYMIHVVFHKESYGQTTCCTESYDNQVIHFLCGVISPFYFIPIPLSQFPPKTSRASNNELNFGDKLSKLQECIPVGGVSQHALDRAVFPSMHWPGGVYPGGVCPGSLCPLRVSAPVGVSAQEVSAQGMSAQGVSAQGGVCLSGGVCQTPPSAL